MKNLKTSGYVLIACISSLIMLDNLETRAQAPNAIPYQAVARNSSGNLIANKNISLRFSIHDLTSTGTVVYSETHSTTTNAFGLFTSNIGQGSALSGTFTGINWSMGSKFIQVEMDTTGSNSYINIGTQQMLSVPYAIYASSSNGWTLSGNGGTNTSTNFIGTTDHADLNFRINNQKAGVLDIDLNNTAFGYQSMNSNTVGNTNTAIGLQALYSNTTGYQNSANGFQALYSNTTGAYNLANGIVALYSNVAGNNGVAIGYNSQGNANNTTTSWDNTNTSIGFQSLHGSVTPSNNTGTENTAIGREALVSNSSGSNNTANGFRSLYANSTGDDNTAIGANALYHNTIGIVNTAIGAGALQFNTSGQYNTASGTNTLYNNTVGNQNTSYGNTAGFSNNSGSGNVFLGYQAGYYETGSNTLYIANNYNSPLIYGDFSTGYVGIGTTSPDQVLSISGNASKTGGGSWATFSDSRMKKNIGGFNEGLNLVNQINPVRFQYNGKGGYADDGKVYVGVVAQDIQKIAPYMVSIINKKLDEDDSSTTELLMYDPSALDYILVNAIKELSRQNNELKTENENLKTSLDNVQSKILSIESKIDAMANPVNTVKR